jgi:hypothetical protein
VDPIRLPPLWVKRSIRLFGLMSASTGCGHCVAHGYVGDARSGREQMQQKTLNPC